MAIIILSGTSTDLANTANYSSGALPSNGDTLIIRQRSTGWTSNLSALAAIQLAALIVETSYTGAQTSYITVDADEVFYAGQGTQFMLDFAATTVNVINVQSTGQGASDGLESLRVKGSAIGTINVLDGSVCIAGHLPTETATVAALFAGTNNQAVTPLARIGVGTTITDVTVRNAVVINDGASPAGDVELLGEAGVYTANQNADHPGTVTIKAGRFVDQTDGVIDDLTLDGGTYDASQDPRPKTITDSTLSVGTFSQIANITFTNAPTLAGASSITLAA